MSRRPVIAGVFELPPGRYPDFDAVGLQAAALGGFLRAGQVDPSCIDGLLVTPAGMASGEAADIFVHERWHDALVIRPRFGEVLNVGGASYAVMAARAAIAIERALAEAVLCLGAGTFPAVASGGGRAMAKLVCGMETVEDVIDSRPVAEPFNLLDCSVPCAGGGAFLVTTESTATAMGLAAARILGFGEFHDHGSIVRASDLAAPGIAVSAAAAFAMAGLSPSDVDVAQLYDAFSFNPLLLMEETRLAPPGGSARMALSGETGPGGRLPVNTYGGLLSFGHTGDASGISMISRPCGRSPAAPKAGRSTPRSPSSTPTEGSWPITAR